MRLKLQILYYRSTHSLSKELQSSNIYKLNPVIESKIFENPTKTTDHPLKLSIRTFLLIKS